MEKYSILLVPEFFVGDPICVMFMDELKSVGICAKGLVGLNITFKPVASSKRMFV